MFEQLREQLTVAYKPKAMPDVRCALCPAQGRLIALHVIEFYHDASAATPAAFVPMSETRGTRRGSVPVCVDCAPACSTCGLPIATSWARRMSDLLQAAFGGITFRLGNGYCRHSHPILALLSRGKRVHLPAHTAAAQS